MHPVAAMRNCLFSDHGGEYMRKEKPEINFEVVSEYVIETKL